MTACKAGFFVMPFLFLPVSGFQDGTYKQTWSCC